jgi:hypothetical protein
MPDPDLDYVDKQIAMTLQRIARQRAVIENVRTLKVDTRTAERLMQSMQRTLDDLRTIKHLIEDDLTNAKASSRF